MSRKRVIDIDGLLFDSELCSELGPKGLILYVLLWGIADDSGVYEPCYADIALKTGALRYTAKEVHGYIQKLIAMGKVIPFKSQREFHWLKNFYRHQALSSPSLPCLPLPEWIRYDKRQYPSGKSYCTYHILAEKLPDTTSNFSETTGSLPVAERNGEKKPIETILSSKKDDGSIFLEVISHLNNILGTNFKATTGKTRELINTRLCEGFGIDDFKLVINVKVSQWDKDPKQRGYLRPLTLFGPKFEGYLQEAKRKSKGTETGGSPIYDPLL